MGDLGKGLIIALILLPLSFSAFATDSLDKQEEALGVIADFAERICIKEPPLKGEVTNLELSGSAKGELNSLLKKIADLGIEGAVKFQKKDYENFLQKDLAPLVKESSKCKLEVFKELKDKLFTTPIIPKTEEVKDPFSLHPNIWNILNVHRPRSVKYIKSQLGVPVDEYQLPVTPEFGLLLYEYPGLNLKIFFRNKEKTLVGFELNLMDGWEKAQPIILNGEWADNNECPDNNFKGLIRNDDGYCSNFVSLIPFGQLKLNDILGIYECEPFGHAGMKQQKFYAVCNNFPDEMAEAEKGHTTVVFGNIHTVNENNADLDFPFNLNMEEDYLHNIQIALKIMGDGKINVFAAINPWYPSLKKILYTDY